MRKITKVNAKKFIKEAELILKEYKAEPIESHTSMTAYKINTKAGGLKVSIESLENLSQFTLYSIFTRFDEPTTAREKGLSNSYSGKNNFFEFDQKECLDEFKSFIDNVLFENERSIKP